MVLIEFDGFCNFCDGFINWVIDKNKRGNIRLKFQENSDSNSIRVLVDGIVYTKAGAIRQIFENIDMPYRLLSIFFSIPLISNLGYIIFANYRYDLFGRKRECSINNYEKIKQRFI